MKKVVLVRNLRIGEGIPKICVPLVGKGREDIIEEAKNLTDVKFDLVEWRVDHYVDALDLEKVKETLVELRKVLNDIPILFTFRSLKEGGEKEVSVEYYKKLNNEISATKNVDLIDVELFTGDEIVKEIVEFAKNNGVKVVMSNHDFFKTPSKEEIVSRLCKMQDLGADLPKIAVMPQSTADVLTLLCATDEMVTKFAKTPIITMSMAGIGVISRISGEIFGSALTFGAAKEASAPGQLSVDKLNKVLEIIHESK